MLPDLALLEIFHFYMNDEEKERVEAWRPLVHVCRKWRQVVFESPRRLDLWLYCGAGTPVKEKLDIWPHLPIAIWGYGVVRMRGVDNIIAALGHSDRICQLGLENISSSRFEKVLALMQQPFPELTYLKLWSHDKEVPVIPTSFLGGSAPRLRTFDLEGIPFPGLPKLLLSATQLVRLELYGIPHSGYIAPDAMVAALSVLTRLETLVIKFIFPYDSPLGVNSTDWKSRRPPLPTRNLLPVLTKLDFVGVDKYLEDLVSRIDVPELNNLEITVFHQLIFDTLQLTHFISRTPKFKPYDEASIIFSNWDVSVTLPRIFDRTKDITLSLGVEGLSTRSDWEVSSLVQVCRSFFPQTFIPAVEHLDILDDTCLELRCLDYIESSQWLDLFRPFTAVKYLYITRYIAPHIARALRELVGERVTEVFPALQNLLLDDTEPVRETIEPFIAARQLAGRPVAVCICVGS